MGLDLEFKIEKKEVPIVFPQVFSDIPNNVPHVLNVFPQEVPNKTFPYMFCPKFKFYKTIKVGPKGSWSIILF